jgi:hypothetical protein
MQTIRLLTKRKRTLSQKKSWNEMIEANHYKKWLLTLLQETFGLPTQPAAYFLDSGSSGYFGVLENVRPELASQSLRPGNATVASHCNHVVFLLQVVEKYVRGEDLKTNKKDWEENWHVTIVSESEWNLIRKLLRDRYDQLIASIEGVENWSEEALADSLIVLVHSAYHLGEIRQIISSAHPHE